MPICEHCHSTINDEAAYCPFCGERVQGQTECGEYEYVAFISYRHLPFDSKVAVRLQRSIEGYRIPKDLRVSDSGKHLGRLFRDEDELPTTSSLSAQIEYALKRSRFLIVVCTPETRESLWVQREVEYFASCHGRERILIALAKGEPCQSFPELLLSKKVVLCDGESSRVETEPLAADFRHSTRKRFKGEMLRIVAALLGCGYDSLRQRERARRNASIAIAIGVVAVVSMAFAGMTAYQRGQVLAKQRELQTSQSRYLAKESAELLAQGDRMQAIQVALGALPKSSISNDRPFVPEAQIALEKATQIYDTSVGWFPCFSHTEDKPIARVAIDEESGTYAVIDKGFLVHVYDMVSGEVKAELDLANDIEGLGDFEPDDYSFVDGMWFIRPNALIVCQSCPESILCVDPYKKRLRWKITEEIEDLFIHGMSVSDDERVLGITGSRTEWTRDGDIEYTLSAAVIDTNSGSIQKVLELERGKEVSMFGLITLDQEGRRLCAIEDNELSVIDLGTGHVSKAKLAYSQSGIWGLSPFWVGDDLIVVSGDDATGVFKKCAVQKYSADCKEVWRTDVDLDFAIVGDQMYIVAPTIWGRLDAVGDMDESVLVSLGGKLVCLSIKDGSISNISNNSSPIIECKVTDVKNGQRIDVCTVEGDVTLLIADKNGILNSTYSASVGYVTSAEFCDVGGLRLVTTTTETEAADDTKTTVHSFKQLSYSSDDETATDAIDLPSHLKDEELHDLLNVLESSLQSVPFEIEKVQFAMLCPDGKEAIVQESGKVMRVSIPSGEVVASTTNSYAGFVAGGFCAGGELFYAQCPVSGDYAGRNDLLIFNMVAQRWSPQSVIRYGAMLTDNASEVVIDAGTTSPERWRLPYLGLDELIDYGHAQCEGFELTDAERQEYLM